MTGGPASRAAAKPRVKPAETQAAQTARAALQAPVATAAPVLSLPAAPRPADLGMGRPLPGHVRADAETRLGADLAAVRLHPMPEDDMAAQATRAYTAGAEIVARDPAALVTPAQRELLLHELTHVLQQTGVPGADGRLHATRRHGRGAAYGLGGELQGENVPSRADLIQHLIDLHRSGVSGTDADLEMVISRISVPGFDPEGVGGLMLSDEVKKDALTGTTKKLHELSRPARGLLFDVLKYGGYFRAAAVLLSGDIDLPSAAYHQPFFEWIHQNSEVARALYPKLYAEDRKQYQMIVNGLPEAIWNYLFDLKRGRQQISGLEPYYDALWEEIYDWTELGRNESSFLGVIPLIQINRDYKETRDELVKKSRGSGTSDLTFKLNMAGGFAEWARSWAMSVAHISGFEWTALAFEKVEAIAIRAKDFWMTALHRYGWVHEIGQGNTEVRKFGRSAPVLKVRQGLKTAGPQLLAVHNGKLPPPHVQRGNRKSFEKEILSLIAYLDEYIRTKTSKEGEFDEAEQDFGALRLLLEDVLENLRYYDKQAETASQEELGDIRIASRLRMARTLSAMARILEMPGLEAFVSKVLSGQDIKATSFALTGPWQEQKGQPVVRLLEDFPKNNMPFSELVKRDGKDVKLLFPFTIKTMVDIYMLFYSRRLVGFLDLVLTKRPPDILGKDEGILSQAYRFAKGAGDRPERWHVDPADVHVSPYKDEPRNWREIVGSHPRTDRELQPLDPVFGGVILPTESGGGVFAWIIPSLIPLIDTLMNIPAINAFAAPEQGEAPTDPMQWLKALAAAAEDPANREKIIAEIDAELSALRAVEDKKLETLIPQAVSLQRRLTTNKINGKLDDYIADDLMNYGAPNDAATEINRFLRLVTPETLKTQTGDTLDHGELQLAAMMLILSSKFETAFSPDSIFGRTTETRFDIITSFAPLMRRALEASEGQNFDQVKTIMSAGDLVKIGNVDNARGRLETLLKSFEKAALEMSERLAFVSDGKVLRSNLFASAIEPSEEPFTHEGRAIRVLQIHEAFTFLPAYGKGTKQVRPPKVVFWDGKDRPPGTPIVRVQFGSGNKIDITNDVTDANLALLEELNQIIADRAFQLSMQNTAAVIEAAGELALDLAEFIPGIGQGITVARALHAIYEFFASNEFDEMLAVIRGDPLELLKQTYEHLSQDLFDSTKIWEFLLFNDTGINYLDKEPAGDQRRDRIRRRGKASRFARIATAIGRIPKSLYESLDEVRERTVPAATSVQVFVATHPKVGFALDFVANELQGAGYIQQLSNMDKLLQGQGDEETIDAKLSEMLAAVDGFQLPKEPIPNDLIIEAMIDFTLDRLERTGRFGKVVKGLRIPFEAVGLIDLIADQIAKALAGTAVDPNVFWRDTFEPELLGAFTEAKVAFVTQANSQLKQYGFAGLPTKQSTTSVERPFKGIEAEASRDPGAAPDPLQALPAPGSGRPLSPVERARTAREFGHDMPHVRMHQGGTAGALTRRWGADGLASGSHIFLRPGLSPVNGRGAQVFRHEMAHVLQNTGGAPIGGAARPAPRPSLGRPGRGLNWNPAREAAADRTARLAGALGHRIGRPLDAGPGGGDGFAPFGGKDFARILKMFSEPADITKHLDELADLGGTQLTAPGIVEAKAIWTGTKTALGKASWSGHAGKAPIRKLIEADLTKGTGATIADNVMTALTLRAQKPKHGAPGKGGVTTELDPDRFANQLEAYIFATRGIALNIKLSGDKVKSVRVYLVDPGRIDDINHPLWQAVFDSPRGKVANDTKKKEIMFRISRYRRPGEQILESKDYDLHKDFRDRFDTLLTETAGISLPNWDDYTTVDPGGPGSKTGHRLYLGKHGDLQSKVPARESHHIPQFVLIEYFQNDADTKLFKDKDKDRLPGFENKQKPSFFDDKGTKIDFDKLDPNSKRGDGMPAILLAARTHKMGRLHIGGKSDWPEGDDYKDAPSGQSQQVDKHFKISVERGLKSDLGAPASVQGSYEDLVGWANEPENIELARVVVWDAMRMTYHWMYKSVMRPALDRALRTEEPKFFTTAAIQNNLSGKSGYDPADKPDRAGVVMRQVDAMQKNNAYEIHKFKPQI